MTIMGFDDEGTETEREKANALLIVQAVNEFDRIGGVEGLQDLERQAAKYLDQRHTFDEAKAALFLSLRNAKSIAYHLPVEKELQVEGASLEVWINNLEAVLAKMERGDHAI